MQVAYVVGVERELCRVTGGAMKLCRGDAWVWRVAVLSNMILLVPVSMFCRMQGLISTMSGGEEMLRFEAHRGRRREGTIRNGFARGH